MHRSINMESPQRVIRLSFDGQLWYAFARLNEVSVELKVHQRHAMLAHEHEARLHTARLEHRLTYAEEQAALTQLGLQLISGRRVYRMRDSSHKVKLREGGFSCALVPESESGFLNRQLQLATQCTPLEPSDDSEWRTLMEGVTGVTVAAIDREGLLIALDSNRRWPTTLDDLENHGVVKLTADVIIDPVHHDYFTPKLRLALRAIGNPSAARDDPLSPQDVCEVYRLRSYLQPLNSSIPASIDTELNKANPSSQVLSLRSRLRRSRVITIVRATPGQVNNLLVLNNGQPQ